MSHGEAPMGIELFPDIGEEIDRRVNHSETRVKYWIMAGIASHLFIMLVTLAPVVFYLGQISRDLTDVSQRISTASQEQKSLSLWMQDRTLWESSAEQWMISQGFTPPRPRN